MATPEAMSKQLTPAEATDGLYNALAAPDWVTYDEIQEWVSQRADVNYIHQDHGFSMLTLAIYSGKLEAMQTLLDAGAEINQMNNEGNTPLHFAIGHRDNPALSQKMVKLLLDRGANTFIRNMNGHDAFGYAAILGEEFNDHRIAVNSLITEHRKKTTKEEQDTPKTPTPNADNKSTQAAAISKGRRKKTTKEEQATPKTPTPNADDKSTQAAAISKGRRTLTASIAVMLLSGAGAFYANKALAVEHLNLNSYLDSTRLHPLAATALVLATVATIIAMVTAATAVPTACQSKPTPHK